MLYSIMARGVLSIINCNVSCLFDFFNGYFYIITIAIEIFMITLAMDLTRVIFSLPKL